MSLLSFQGKHRQYEEHENGNRRHTRTDSAMLQRESRAKKYINNTVITNNEIQRRVLRETQSTNFAMRNTSVGRSQTDVESGRHLYPRKLSRVWPDRSAPLALSTVCTREYLSDVTDSSWYGASSHWVRQKDTPLAKVLPRRQTQNPKPTRKRESSVGGASPPGWCQRVLQTLGHFSLNRLLV